MRTTRAYIASAGTASVLLGAALVMLVVVSAFVAFGSWPGTSSGKQLDEVLLNEVSKPKAAKVAVGAKAVQAARRAETRRQLAVARAEGRTRGGKPADSQTTAQAPAGSAPTTAAGTPVAAAPGDSSPVGTVRQQTKDATQTLQQTTQDVGTQVGNTVDQTTSQVNQVVDQVVGGVQQTTDTTVQQVQGTVGGATNTVTGTVNTTTDAVQNAGGSLLGH
jgi:hypothetical protein